MRRCARLSIALALVLACAGGSGVSATTGDDASASSTSQSSSASDGLSSTSVATTISTTSTTATSTSTTTPTTASTTEGESTGPACSMDHGDNSSQCDVWAQAGCCHGEKCNPWAKDGGGYCAARCAPIAPDPDGIGEPCSVVDDWLSGIDTCVAGAICWDVDPRTNVGVCVELCHESEAVCSVDPASCCPEHHACTLAACGVLALCHELCHPLLQDCSGQGRVCYPLSEGFQCAPDVSGEMGAAGDPCEFINVCDPGTFCGDPAAFPGCDPQAAGCCIPFCALGDPQCPPGTECQPWYDPQDTPAGYEDLGACVVPG